MERSVLDQTSWEEAATLTSATFPPSQFDFEVSGVYTRPDVKWSFLQF